MDEQGTNEGDELTLAPVNVISRKRPKALWGVLAAVAVAAGALAVTSGGGDGATGPLLPIVLGSGGVARQADAAADSMLAWVTYVPGDALPALGGEAPAYQLSGTVDDAKVRALADALGLSGDVAHDAGLWTVTGADGASLQVSEGAGASWWFSALGPDVAVGRPATGSSGSLGDASHEASCETTPEGAIVCPSVTTPAPLPVDCAEVEAGDCPGSVDPPADLPSEDDARAIALDLLAVTGMDTDDAVVTVDGPYDVWYVMVEPAIEGTPSGLLANVSVGPGGLVTSAGGYLGTPERLGDYPILDTRDAIARLNEQMGNGGWFAYPSGVARDVAVASGQSALAEGGVDDMICSVDPRSPQSCEEPLTVGAGAPATTVPLCRVQADGSGICEGSGSGEAPTPELPRCPDLVPPVDEPLPEDAMAECVDVGPVPGPMPEPEPTEVVLIDATPTLILVPASDGSADAYLVPGYRFTGEDGVPVDAPAIADAALAGSPTTEPPVDPPITGTSLVPDPGGTDGGSTPPSGCEPLVEEDSAGTTHTIKPCPGVDPTEPVLLPAGEDPLVGVAYYVDIDTRCGGGTFLLGRRGPWVSFDPAIPGWPDEGSHHEGGTFTLDAPDRGTFVGDAGSAKVAEFRWLRQDEDIFCLPSPRP